MCGACQERLNASDEFVAAVKAAGAQMSRRGLARAANAGGSGGSPVTLAAAAVVIGGLSLFLSWQPAPSMREFSRVKLESLRGEADSTIHRAPRAHRLLLDIDTSRLPADGVCRLQIVDHRGDTVWEQRVRVNGSTVSVSIDSALAAGRYWARLYGPELSGDPWREYGFEID